MNVHAQTQVKYLNTYVTCPAVGVYLSQVMCAVLVCSDEVPNDLSGRLYHLEVMLQQLNSDLERVRILCFSLFFVFIKQLKLKRLGPHLNPEHDSNAAHWSCFSSSF